MNRNSIYILVIAVLGVAVGVLGYQTYQAQKQPDGVQINLGREGVTIQQK